MSNQKKNIKELGYAEHGYPTGIIPKTVKDLEGKIVQLKSDLEGLGLSDVSNLDNVPVLDRKMEDLFRIDIAEFNNLQYGCCLVDVSVIDFPRDLKETDQYGYVFTNRNEKFGVQMLIGAQSGFQFTRRMNSGAFTAWTAVQGSTGYYATFEINPLTGELEMHTDPGYSGANFSLEDGNLTVTI